MSSLLELVKHYQHYINKYPNDKDTVLKCIDLLYNLEVTVQHLQETGVGRTVNALRKEPGEVGQAARALVYKWKMMVASEESDHEEDRNDSTSYNEPEYDRNCNPSESKNRHVKSEKNDNKPKTEENHSRSHHTTNGDYSGSKRKYHSSEEEDLDRKKSKYSSTKDNGYKQPEIKVKVEPSDSESDSEDSESSSSDEEKPDIKVKIEKTEKIEKHETTSHKHHHSSHDKHKYESSSGHTKEHYKHNNLERHSSSKDKSSSSHSQSSSRESSKVVEKEQKSDKDRSHSKESSDRHKTHKDSEKHKSSSSSEKQKSSSSSEKHKSNDNSEKHRSSSSSEKHKHSSSSEKHKSNSSSVDKHGSSSSSEKHKSTNSEKQKSHSERSSSHSEKHSSSSKSDKDKHKSSSEKEITNDKHKLKETNTSSSSDSSSKDKQSSSSKEKSKDKHSSKEKETSHKSDKKHSSSKELKSSDSKKKHESNVDTSSIKRKHKSSSSSSKSSSSKSKDDIPKKKSQVNGQDSDDGIDCGSGASFAEALGMISPAKPKKKSFTRDSTQSPNSCSEDLSPATLLAPTAKLAPLPALEISALPEISPNYRPRPPPKFLPHFTDEDAMSVVISSKNQRTKVYSGNKVMGKIPTLYEMCVNILQEHIDALEYTGGVPYEILKPVVDKATPQQLFMLEHFNPYLMEDTDHLWQKFCEKSFRNKKREEMESWREMYMRCQEEQEIRLKSLTANIRITQAAKKAPIKQTKMAYVDSVVKPPRNVLKKQAQHGTAFAATASPAARVAALAAAPNVLKGGRAAPAPVLTPSSAALKPKKAPLMQKALQFMRGKKR